MKQSRLLSKLSLFLCLSLALTLFPTVSVRADDPFELENVSAAVLMDAASGNMLYATNWDVAQPVAGLTIMMTALVAHNAVVNGEVAYSDLVTATETLSTGISKDAATQGILVGEQMTLEQLLYCALIGSGSDACNVIAEYVAGSIESFVERMNTLAAELKCKDTNFVNTHGLTAAGQYSTAEDMARIASAFVNCEELMDIANSTVYDLPETNLSPARTLTNGNLLLRQDYTRYYYSYANGIKSSYTEAAGYCLASAVRTDNAYVVSIVLGCEMLETANGYYDIQSFVQTRTLFKWFFENYSLREVLNPIAPVAEVPVLMGEGMDSVVVCASTGLSLFLPNSINLTETYTRHITIYSEQEGADPVVAPVARNQVLGEMTITDSSGTCYGPFILVANSSVALSRLEYIKDHVRAAFHSTAVKLILAFVLLLLILYFIFFFRYNMIRSRRRKARKAAIEAAARGK